MSIASDIATREKMSRHYTVILEDGDTLSVIAQLQPSLSDMANTVAAVAQRYRIVADVCAPTLALVPLNEKPGKLSLGQLSECKAGQ